MALRLLVAHSDQKRKEVLSGQSGFQIIASHSKFDLDVHHDIQKPNICILFTEQ